MSVECETTTTELTSRLTARVKWFNNKAGYGFITVSDGEQLGTDIFVHHSAIKVDNQQYKYLVQGEYVDFDLTKTVGAQHEFQAQNVSGIKGGKLMCETRFDFKTTRNSYEGKTTTATMPVQKRLPRESSDGWSRVEKVATDKKPRVRPSSKV